MCMTWDHYSIKRTLSKGFVLCYCCVCGPVLYNFVLYSDFVLNDYCAQYEDIQNVEDSSLNDECSLYGKCVLHKDYALYEI